MKSSLLQSEQFSLEKFCFQKEQFCIEKFSLQRETFSKLREKYSAEKFDFTKRNFRKAFFYNKKNFLSKNVLQTDKFFSLLQRETFPIEKFCFEKRKIIFRKKFSFKKRKIIKILCLKK